MAKGKFSHPRKEGEEDMIRRFSRALQEDETLQFHAPTENPLDSHDEAKKPDTDRSMPACDFRDFTDLDSLKDLNIPELSALDLDSEESEFGSMFEAIPSAPSEEEQIETAFHAAVEPQKIRRERRSAFWSRGGKKLLIGLTVVFALVLSVLGGIALYQNLSDPYHHQILNGVHVAGVNLGAMTRQQAEQAVAAAADTALSHTDMMVRLPDQVLTLSPAATKISLNVKDAVQEAYDYGRTGSRSQRELAFRKSMTEDHFIDLRPYLKADEKYILGLLKSYADSHDSAFLPSSYALEGEQPPLGLQEFNENNTPQTLLLILGNPGFHLDTRQALEQIMAAYSVFDLNPSLKLEQGDKKPASLDLKKIQEEYTIAPVNSTMDKESFQIISGSYGLTFDLLQATAQLKAAQYGDTVRIPMEYVKPEIMDDGVYFQDTLSAAETPHGKNKKRNVNLDLACKALDGIVLYPGDEFSYNQTLGQRTAEKGYQAAPAYSGDTLVNSLGGGICQVSSTLYYSCMLADLQITDRINHGFLPSYIAPGMDATVSWGNPDFKFRNNMDYPIKISAEATEDKVIVRILGTDTRDYYVKMEYEMTDVLPPEIYEEHGPDSGYTDGQIINPGTIGHSVKTFRCKYRKETDELISRDPETRSSYMTRPKIIAVVKGAATPEPQVPDEGGGSPDTGGGTVPENPGEGGQPPSNPDSGGETPPVPDPDTSAPEVPPVAPPADTDSSQQPSAAPEAA